jgi:hypothetical protein
MADDPVLIAPADLAPFAIIDSAKAAAMIIDAIAMATLAAPCLADTTKLTPVQLAATKAVLRAAILRWNDAGSGAVQTSTMGPFNMAVDTKQPRRQMFWPSEITDLQKICRDDTTSDGGAFSIDTAAPPVQFHSVLCGFGGGACTCGAIAFDSDDSGAGFI